MDSKTWSSADLIMLFIKIIGWGIFEKIGFVFEAKTDKKLIICVSNDNDMLH